MDQAGDALFLHTLNGRIVDINQATIKRYGYTREELLELTADEIDTDYCQREQGGLFWDKLKKMGLLSFEAKHRRRDGTVFPVEVTLSAVAVGGSPHILALARDITERKMTEEARARLQAQLANALEMAHLGPWEYDVASDLFTFNDQFYKIFRTTASEVGGYSLSSAEYSSRFLHPEDVHLVGEETRKAIEASDPHFSRNLEHRILYDDGTVGYIRVRFCVVKDKDGRTIKTYGVNQDVTERKLAEEEKQRLEAQLNQAQKMEAVGTLAGGIAHEFNNILGIILGNVELAEGDIPEWNPAKYKLDEIKAASLRARGVVRQLLTFSRKGEENQKPLDLTLVVKEAIRFLRASIPTSIEIRQNIADRCHTIIADATQIHQVILNLSTNAAHAMEETGGILEFFLQNFTLEKVDQRFAAKLSPGEYLLLEVSDNGAGISAEIIDRIFDPYFTTKEVGKGTGMGLSVVHGIVEAHGGSIQVESEPGSGTTFKILFPATKEEIRSALEPEEELPTGNERILFIDDEQSLAKLGRLMLEALGYQVQAETNPRKALELFAPNPEQFDLIITDTTMPGMTGDQLIKKVLQIRPEMKTILCTGYSQRVDEESARTIGAKAYALKPLDRKKLAVTVRKVLDERA